MAPPVELETAPDMNLQLEQVNDKKTSIELTTFPIEPETETNDEKSEAIEALYSSWSQSRPAPPPYEPGKTLTQEWRKHAAEAWLDANKKCAADYEQYCLAQFIQCCALYDAEQFRFVEANCIPGSSLRRFSRYWVAWNQYLTGAKTTKWAGLQAAWASIQMLRTSEDPRPYALEHWYSSCGDDFAPTCEHIPSVRQANLEKSRKPPKPAEVVRGRSLEIQARQMAPPQVATAPTLQRAPSPPWAARSHTVARPTSGHSVCSRVLWTIVFLGSWLWMAGIAGVLAGGVLETHLNGSMVRFVAAFCVWTVIIFIMILAIRKSARRYYWWYFVPWIPAFVMMAVNTAQCSKRYDGGSCAAGGGLAAATFINMIAMYLFARAWHRE